MSFLGSVKNAPRRVLGKLRGKRTIPVKYSVMPAQNHRALSTTAGNKLANISNKPIHHPSPAAALFAGFDDFFAPSPLFKNDPFFQDWMPVLRNLDRSGVADDMVLRRSSPGWEINESETEYQIAIDVPGVKASDMTIQLEDDGRVLHLTGGRKVTRGGQTTETKFEKRFTIGENVDAASMTANLSDGVLVVKAPKLQKVEPEPMKITITEGGNNSTVLMEEETEKAA